MPFTGVNPSTETQAAIQKGNSNRDKKNIRVLFPKKTLKLKSFTPIYFKYEKFML